MKKNILSLLLAISLCFAMAILTYAADGEDAGIIIRYEGNEYTLSVDAEGSQITDSTTITKIEEAIETGKAQDDEDASITITGEIMLYFDNRLIGELSRTLGQYGISMGSTIDVYNESDCVNVRFEGKDYAVKPEEWTVNGLKNEIFKDATNGGMGIKVENQLLYDANHNFITGDSISGGSTVYLYNKESGKITSTEENYNNYKIPVTATYTQGASADTTYYVEITWGSMVFTYKEPDKEWDPVTHKEKDATGSGGWTCTEGADEVTVKNHSNVNVKVQFNFKSVVNHYTAGSGDGFTIIKTLNNEDESISEDNSIVLDSAVDKNEDEPATVVVALKLSGELISDPRLDAIGHITVTVSAVQQN